MNINGMDNTYIRICISARIRMMLLCACCMAGMHAQTDTLMGRNLYSPDRFRDRDTIKITVPSDSLVQPGEDSLALRLQFVRDSLLARERFIRDSIQQRKRRLDSLTFLQRELPVLLDAYFKTVREDMIVYSHAIEILGDSALGDFSYLLLPFNVTQPYTPWKVSLGLSGRSVRIISDKTAGKITSVQAPFMKCTFTYGDHNTVLVIHELSTIQNDRSGQFYRLPFDSVFFDSRQRVVKIKKYVYFHSLVNDHQRGAPLFHNLSQVKQYEYMPDGRIRRYQVVSFCDRWKAIEPQKVCNVITWDYSIGGNTYRLTRHNDPANLYSDGTFTFEFDDNENLKSVSFQNLALTESWKRIVELTAEGNVNCYVDWKNDRVVQSLCMVYNRDPGAKYPVETLTTTYEEDGISYFQRNNMTGKSRIRDKMTMEWGPWR